ncbi:hypothetical protein PV325_005557 [Microctonus aethiopoides]|nr:hypothetical protein PV325_005557 [Microctonus aethiopoides]
MAIVEGNISIDLIKWDSPENALAPLSKQQKNRILRLEEESSTFLLSNDNNETTMACLKSENLLDNEGIETYRQLLRCYAALESKYNQTECTRYVRYLEQLKDRTVECHDLCEHIEKALEDFSTLSKQYAIVSGKTTALHDATEQLISQQEKLNDMYHDISIYVKYFKEGDFIMEKLEMPNLSVRSELFMDLTSKIEENINFIEKHNTFKEALSYLVKYRHCQSKAIMMMQQWIYDLLEQATESILNQSAVIKEQNENTALGIADTALALFYGRFQSILPKVKPIIDIIEKRSINRQEYESLLGDCQQHYLMKRGSVLGTSVRKGLQSIKESHKGDHCSLVRQACALLLHASIDEHRLFYQFFSIKSPALTGYLEGLCNSLYDALRPSIIHINHLETLAEICCILRIEMLEEHVQNNMECLEGFGNICLQLLHDAQERLVFRAHLYLQSDIQNYNPSPGDLAYPDKLRMMEDIAETLREETRQARIKKISVSTVSSFLEDHNIDSTVSVTSTSTVQSARNNHIAFEPIPMKSGTTNSPADLHGMWYPTVRRTLVCLSRLYRCVDRPVFQSLSREAITYCVESIEVARDKIETRATELDAELFQIKHLLILREQLAPFQVDFTVKEYSLDFSKVKTAAFGLLEKRSRFFTLSNNALLEFFLEGAPRMKEHLIDSRKHVDVKLKISCQRLIQHATRLLVEPLIIYLEKFKFRNPVVNANSGAPPSNDELCDPQKVSAMVSEALRMIKFRLPNIQQSMQLYLANRETESILFRPIRNNVVATFTQFFQTLQTTFTAEQQILIGCPLPEQVSVMLSSSSLVSARNNPNDKTQIQPKEINNDETNITTSETEVFSQSLNEVINI